MKYRLLLIFAVVAAASPIAADTIETGEKLSMENLTYNNSILLSSTGGETVLSSTLSERGGVFVSDRTNGMYTQLRKGHVQDLEQLNRTHVAYVSRNLTGDGIDSRFRIENFETGELLRDINISRDVNDVERRGSEYMFANSSGVYAVGNTSEKIASLYLDDEAEVVDMEFSGNSTVLATQEPDQVAVQGRNYNKIFNISRPEDMQLIGLRPLNILVIHESKVIEYKETDEGLEEVWRYSGLENGRAVNRLPDNTTVIADQNSVFAVNSSGEEIWKKQFFSTSDIESSGDKAYSLEGSSSGVEVDSYWTSKENRTEEVQVGFIEGLLQASFNSFFG